MVVSRLLLFVNTVAALVVKGLVFMKTHLVNNAINETNKKQPYHPTQEIVPGQPRTTTTKLPKPTSKNNIAV
jgi:hypothetical protein